jgi:hypothetical protein
MIDSTIIPCTRFEAEEWFNQSQDAELRDYAPNRPAW